MVLLKVQNIFLALASVSFRSSVNVLMLSYCDDTHFHFHIFLFQSRSCA
jgi:hypothetical protein